MSDLTPICLKKNGQKEIPTQRRRTWAMFRIKTFLDMFSYVQLVIFARMTLDHCN